MKPLWDSMMLERELQSRFIDHPSFGPEVNIYNGLAHVALGLNFC